MSKVKIGIVLPPSEYGGVYQYSLSIIESLVRYSKLFEYVVLHTDDLPDLPTMSHVSTVRLRSYISPLKGKLSIFANLALDRTLFNMNNHQEKALLQEASIKLLVIPFPSFFGFRNGIRYIVSIPDMMHKYFPSFPEFPLKERMMRDFIYRNSAKNASFSVVDDTQGLEDLRRFYGINRDTIRVIPYIPPGYIYAYQDMNLQTADNILRNYSLPSEYLFYPAQCWYHKNHLRLISALRLIKEDYGVSIPLVLAGFTKWKYESVINAIRDLSDQITHVGFVSEREIVALYKKSTALVYPSLFGPTNIPPLEAMLLGTPVACSNVFSMPRQIGSAGVLFDPLDVKDISEKIFKIWTDESLRRKLILKGYEKTKNLTLENYAQKWESLIEEAVISLPDLRT